MKANKLIMMIPSSLYKLYTIIAVIIIVAVSSFFLGILPLFDKIKSNADKFREYKKDLLVINGKRNTLKETKEEYQKIEDGVNKITGSLLGENIINFVQLIENIAKDTNNIKEIQLISSGSDSKKEIQPNLEFKISLWGTFPTLISFLTKLENMPYLVDVTSIQIDKANSALLKEDISFPVSIRTDFRVKAYTR